MSVQGLALRRVCEVSPTVQTRRKAVKPATASSSIRSEAICALAGLPGFVRAMRKLREEVGADPDNVCTGEFDGY